MSSKRGSIPPDLRKAARHPVPRRALGQLLTVLATAPPEARLWLADRWPWTPGTDAALSRLRPRWALAVIELDAARPLERMSAEAAVRELNRAFDPYPAQQARRASAPPGKAGDDAPDDDE